MIYMFNLEIEYSSHTPEDSGIIAVTRFGWIKT